MLLQVIFIINLGHLKQLILYLFSGSLILNSDAVASKAVNPSSQIIFSSGSLILNSDVVAVSGSDH